MLREQELGRGQGGGMARPARWGRLVTEDLLAMVTSFVSIPTVTGGHWRETEAS